MSKSVAFLISCVLTAVTVFALVTLFVYDYFLSVIPGWHTTIYTGDQTLVWTIAILFVTLITNMIFKFIRNVLFKINKS